MTQITDAQVDVAEGAYWAVLTSHDPGEGFVPIPASPKAMRAALEAYERVRDVERILRPESMAENDARADQGLKNLHRKLQKDYPR